MWLKPVSSAALVVLPEAGRSGAGFTVARNSVAGKSGGRPFSSGANRRQRSGDRLRMSIDEARTGVITGPASPRRTGVPVPLVTAALDEVLRKRRWRAAHHRASLLRLELSPCVLGLRELLCWQLASRRCSRSFPQFKIFRVVGHPGRVGIFERAAVQAPTS